MISDIKTSDMSEGDVARELVASNVHIIFAGMIARKQNGVQTAHGREHSFIFFLVNGNAQGLRLDGGTKEERVAVGREAVRRTIQRFGGELL